MGNLERDRCPTCNARVTPQRGRIVYCDDICAEIARELRKTRGEVLEASEHVLNDTWRAELRYGVERWQRETLTALTAYRQAQRRLDALLYAARQQGANDRELSDITELRLVQIRDRVSRFVSSLTKPDKLGQKDLA